MTTPAPKEEAQKPADNQVNKLVALGKTAEYFLDFDDRPFARVKIDDHYENLQLSKVAFTQWLEDLFFVDSGQKRVASSAALDNARRALMAHARRNGTGHRSVRVRSGQRENKHFIDIGDKSWKVLEITPEGVRTTDDTTDLRFKRTKGARSLPEIKRPTSDKQGRLERWLNIVSPDDVLMFKAFALRAIGDWGERGGYPILVLRGEQGTAKTTAAKVLRKIIDPSGKEIQGEPGQLRDLMIQASNMHLLIYDNLSSVPPRTSDHLCGIATGTSFSTRLLHSDDDEYSTYACRPIILAGIGDVVSRPDLIDRSVLVNLEFIPEKKRSEDEAFWTAFEEDLPYILYRLYHGYSRALRLRDDLKLDKLPRMAGFARFAAAALGPDFLPAYERNRSHHANEAALENSIIFDSLMEYLGTGDDFTGFLGTASDLKMHLEQIVTKDGKRRLPAVWPQTAQGFTAELDRIKPNLRVSGIFIKRSRSKDRRQLTISREPGTDE